MKTQNKVYLYLKDGTKIKGIGFGNICESAGEIIFTTSMNNYPESLTDPSYKGQILVITHPLVGNYGVPKKIYNGKILSNFESENIQVEGLIINELTSSSKWNSIMDLDSWLKSENIPGIQGIDTRALTQKIRDSGVTNGIISENPNLENLEKHFKNYEKTNFIEIASVKKPVEYHNGRKNIVVVDLGIKHGILNELYNLKYNIIRVPYNFSADKILSYSPVGIVYGNGPGNPIEMKEQIKTFSEIAEYKLPLFGICLGHQIAALAFGGSVKKMKFGHRATNKAVIEQNTKRAYITSHNHGYAVYPKGIPKESKIWFISPDDNVVEGLIFKKYNIITTQFHPEARPGTNDAKFIFNYFDKLIKNAD
jgi:carbamoyl-phosphate synthase small subunit